MLRGFNVRFKNLINEEVPRSFLRSQETRSGRLDEKDYGKPLDDFDEIYSVPEDGFVNRFCKETIKW